MSEIFRETQADNEGGKHPYLMDLEELKAHALDLAKSAIDKMQSEAEATYLIGGYTRTEKAVLNRRERRKTLAVQRAPFFGSGGAS